MSLPKWINLEETGKQHRKKSDQQEKRIAKKLGGRVTANSGARFGENDVLTDTLDMEIKGTKKKQYTLKLSDLDKMVRKSRSNRYPAFLIEFFDDNGNPIRSMILTDFSDFLEMTGMNTEE
jgi:hypothetical protein